MAPISYLYCSRNATDIGSNNANDVLRSILRQLSRTILAEYERREVESKLHGLELVEANIDDCVKFIRGISNSNPMTIIIDAIDEVQHTEACQLVEALRKMVPNALHLTRIARRYSMRCHSKVGDLSEFNNKKSLI